MAKKQNIEIFFKINGLEAYIDDLETLNETLDKVAKATKDASDEQEKLEKSSGKFGKVLASVGKVGKTAFRGIGLALKATGLGVFLELGSRLVEWFQSTDVGSKIAAGSLAALGVIFNRIGDLVSRIIDFFKPLFEDPLESIKDFGNTIKNFVVDRINAFLEGIGFLGSAVSALFRGEFAEALDLAKQGVKTLAFEATGLNKAVEAGKTVVKVATQEFKSLAKEVTAAVVASNKLVDAQNRLEEETAKLIVENAELNKELETQKQIAEDTTLAYDERKAALDRVNAANEQLAENAIKQAALELDALERAKALANTDAERRDLITQIAEATATLTDAQTQQQIVRQESARLSRELDAEEEERIEDIEDLQKAADKAKVNSAIESFSALNALAVAFASTDEKRARQNFKIQKGLSLAEATLSGIEGVQNAYTTAKASPITKFFPAYPIVQAGLATAFSAARIAAISRTQFNPAGGGAGGVLTRPGGGGGQINPGNIGLPFGGGGGGLDFTLDTTGATTGQGLGPQKVYVISTEVSNAQEADKQIDNLARL